MKTSDLTSDSPPAIVDDGADHCTFPFMKLPAEMRLHVYRMCLKRDKPVLLHMPRPPTSKEEEDLAAFEDRDGLSLTDLASSQGSPSSSMRVSRNSNNNTTAASNRTTTADSNNTNQPLAITTNGVVSLTGRPSLSTATWSELCNPNTNINDSPLVPAILRLSKQIYREARPVLYADNEFALRLDTALHTMTSLHQRSRSMIKQVHITIHSHHDILEGFADLVRLGLRYCWGLEVLHLKLTTAFPEDSGSVRGSSVYANAFHILRWLPKSCKVRLDGKVPGEVERIIRENERHAEVLDEKAYQRRQHQMPEKRPTSSSSTSNDRP